jgi:serine/threonine protein kinase
MARAAEPSLAAGTIVADSYRIGQLLGKGGMGEVFEAHHLASDVLVAIKLLKESASETIVERFGREGRALGQMRSEHVIKVFDVGVLANGRPFIVMELLVGADLQVIKEQRGTLPMNRAVSYILQACVGLAEAHGLGIVHRDLKPANLYLAELPDGRTVIKVLDFGISKVNALAKAGKTGLTAADDVFGSPKYMSPEQLRATRDVDVRTDIWSLGVTLAELVTGKTPFEAEDFGTLVFNILEADPPSVAHVDEMFGADLDEVVRRCLARDPNDRFPSIDALADALAPLVDVGQTQSQLVHDTLHDATRRGAQLEGRAQPQVTRVLETSSQTQTAAIVRIEIAPIQATVADRAPPPPPPVAAKPPPPVAAKQVSKKGVPMPFVLGAVACIAAGALGAGLLFDGSDKAESRVAPEPSEETPRAKKKRKKKRDEAESPEPTSAPRPMLPAKIARQRTFDVAPDIGQLLKATHPAPVEVRDMLFFNDRAVMLVASGEGVVRYDYKDGQLSDPKPARVTSGARRSERVPLSELKLDLVKAMADKADADWGKGKLHSIALLWRIKEMNWVAASSDGDLKHYDLNGVER